MQKSIHKKKKNNKNNKGVIDIDFGLGILRLFQTLGCNLQFHYCRSKFSKRRSIGPTVQ